MTREADSVLQMWLLHLHILEKDQEPHNQIWCLRQNADNLSNCEVADIFQLTFFPPR